jgi:hypothetical protein
MFKEKLLLNLFHAAGLGRHVEQCLDFFPRSGCEETARQRFERTFNMVAPAQEARSHLHCFASQNVILQSKKERGLSTHPEFTGRTHCGCCRPWAILFYSNVRRPASTCNTGWKLGRMNQRVVTSLSCARPVPIYISSTMRPGSCLVKKSGRENRLPLTGPQRPTLPYLHVEPVPGLRHTIKAVSREAGARQR